MNDQLPRVALEKIGFDSDATGEVAKLQEHYDIGPLDHWITVDTSGMPQQSLARSLAQRTARQPVCGKPANGQLSAHSGAATGQPMY